MTYRIGGIATYDGSSRSSTVPRPATSRQFERWIAGLVFAMIGYAEPAGAGTISIALQLAATWSPDNRLHVQLEITNSGDEPGFDLRTTIEFENARSSLEAVPVLDPSRTTSQVARISTESLARRAGTWPVVVRVAYTDSNRRPFEALHVGVVQIGAADGSGAIDLELSASPVARGGTLRATVRSDLAGAVDLRFVAPSPLLLAPEHAVLRLDPAARSQLEVSVTNRGATPGSRLPVFAVARYAGHTSPRSDVVSTTLEIVSPQPVVHTAVPLKALLAILVAVWLAILVRAARRGGSGA